MRKSLVEAIENAHKEARQPPAALVEAFNRNFMAAASGEPRIFKRAGDVAEIRIEGALTPKPDWWAYYFCGGNTTYPEIIQALALAAADQGVKRIVLNIASPGGYVEGLFDCLAALEAFSKPKETFASKADSAAYAILSLGGKATAANPASEFGSVGVCATYVRYDGENIYDITSTNAPYKRPDPSTKDGQAIIRAELDAIEELFLDAIARGRGTTVKNVIKNFGQGAVLLANAALDAGMIDAIAGKQLRTSEVDDADEEDVEPDDVEPEEDGEEEAARAGRRGSSGNVAPSAAPASAAITTPAPPHAQKPEPAEHPAPTAPKSNASAAPGGAATTRKPMTKEELKAQHPEVYSAVFNDGKAEGKTEADTKAKADAESEKDRIEAHLTAGEESGDMKTAIASIRSGDKMTQKLLTTYMMAGRKTRDVAARAEDEVAAAAATSGAAGKEPVKKTFFEEVADAVEAQSKGGAAA